VNNRTESKYTYQEFKQNKECGPHLFKHKINISNYNLLLVFYVLLIVFFVSDTSRFFNMLLALVLGVLYANHPINPKSLALASL
jgi:hypothetical protein